MNYRSLVSVIGTIRNISAAGSDCRSRVLSLLTQNGPVNLTVSADTTVINNTALRVGMRIAAFYDGSLPVPLIYPPQYRAVIVTALNSGQTAVLSYFNEQLISANPPLQLNIGRTTRTVTLNGQNYTCTPGNHFLLVYYTNTTRSIPPQTTPSKVIVLD